MSQNLSSAAVVIGALRVKDQIFTPIKWYHMIICFKMTAIGALQSRSKVLCGSASVAQRQMSALWPYDPMVP